MKLYAEVMGSKLGRVVSKADDKKICVHLKHKNYHEYTVIYTENGIEVSGDGGILLDCQSLR